LGQRLFSLRLNEHITGKKFYSPKHANTKLLMNF